MPATAFDRSSRSTDAEPMRLSTDYLNRFAEALMLIEMAPMDAEVLDDLRVWTAVGYVEHFAASPLRIAGPALAAYDALPAERRLAFEDVCGTMNRTVAAAIASLAACADEDQTMAVVAVASGRMRGLMSRATQFINANGAIDIAAFAALSLQDAIDEALTH